MSQKARKQAASCPAAQHRRPRRSARRSPPNRRSGVPRLFQCLPKLADTSVPCSRASHARVAASMDRTAQNGSRCRSRKDRPFEAELGLAASTSDAPSNCRSCCEFPHGGRHFPSTMHLKLLENVVDVVLHGGGTDVELAGNLLVGPPTFEVFGHFEFPTGEALELVGDEFAISPSRSNTERASRQILPGMAARRAPPLRL